MNASPIPYQRLTMTSVQLDNILQAYERLPYGTKVHLGYCLRHRSVTSWNVLVNNHGHEPELQEFLDLVRDHGVELRLES